MLGLLLRGTWRDWLAWLARLVALVLVALVGLRIAFGPCAHTVSPHSGS